MVDPIQSPLPGPMATDSFWSRNSKIITRAIIIIVIIGGAILYSRSQQSSAPTDTTDKEQGQISQNGGQTNNGISVTDQSGKSNPKVSVGQSETSETIRVSQGAVTVVAQRGNGYTHLARRALAEYLKTTGTQNLKAEHKIFIEDYLQKHITEKKRLFAGTEVSFSEDQIQQAIDAALKLNDRQIQNLHKYTTVVPNL